MAEGQSYEDGSDILFDFVCTPCAEDGTIREALHSCQTCDQLLCGTCTKYHKKFTTGHRLVPAGDSKRPNKKTPSKPKAVSKCLFHPDRDVEMFCNTHDMVYCSLCIAKDHRSCNGVEEIQDGVHKSDVSRLQKLVAEIDKVDSELSKTKQHNSKNVKLLKAKRTDLLKEIDSLRKEMNTHFDSLERKVRVELDDTISKLEKEMSDDSSVADDLSTNANNQKPVITGNQSDKDMFILEKLGKYAVSEANTFLTKANARKQVNLSFERNTYLYDCIKGADHLGRIKIARNVQHKVKQVKYVVKSTSQRNVHIESDKQSCDIIGMCQLPDGTFLVADVNNGKLKRLDDKLNVRDAIDLKSSPYGVCTISSTDIAVRLHDSIQFVNVDRSLSVIKVVKVDNLPVYGGNSIALCGNHLWTFGDRCVLIYTMSGDVVKKIATDYVPGSIAVSSDMSSVYITTGYDNRVVVYNKSGDVIREVHDRRLNDTSGVCTTDDGIILVAGWDSKNVVMQDEDGKCLEELISDLPDYPGSLCYDRRNCRLIVGCYNNDELQIYELGK